MVAWGCALLMLSAWMAWFLWGNVTVYQVSQKARLEVQAAAHPVTAAIAGKVTMNAAVLGQAVKAGDVLLTLDTSREVLRRKEEESRLANFEPKLASLGRELATLNRALQEEKAASEAAIQSARSRTQEVAAALDFAREQERRLREENKVGGVAQVDALRAAAEAQKLAAALQALQADATRIDNEARIRQSQQQAQIEALERTLSTLQGERTTAQTALQRITQDMEQAVVRAPVDGVLGDIAPLKPGSFVNAGDKLMTIIPAGTLTIVADFSPADVLGRVRPGQNGTLKLDGFPWAEFGSVEARVLRVASEIHDQSVRVELTPLPAAGNSIPLQHGLPGVVEIGIEHTSPAMLVLRTLGQRSLDGLLTPAKAGTTAP